MEARDLVHGWETFALLNDGQFLRAGLNVVLSVGLGLTAAWAGYRLADRGTTTASPSVRSNLTS